MSTVTLSQEPTYSLFYEWVGDMPTTLFSHSFPVGPGDTIQVNVTATGTSSARAWIGKLECCSGGGRRYPVATTSFSHNGSEPIGYLTANIVVCGIQLPMPGNFFLILD